MAQKKRKELNERPSGIRTTPLQGSIQNHFESSPNTKIPRKKLKDIISKNIQD
jgi:hypothetical protein